MRADIAARLGLSSADMPYDLLTTLAAAGTIIGLTLIEPFGTEAAFLFVACLAVLAAKSTQYGGLAWGELFPLLVPGFAILSTLWSLAPDATLRAAVQCGLGALAAVLLARTVSARFMLTVLAVGLVAALPVYVVLDKGGDAMNGAFLSKNQFAGRMALTVFASAYLVARTDVPRATRIAAFFCWAISVLFLY